MMDILTRGCWYATWCGAGAFKVAKRRWLEEVVMLAMATCRGPGSLLRTVGEPAHVTNLRC